MNAKALLIPMAAFALTVTAVQAFNPEVLEEIGLNEEQITALETARELRKEGDRDAARDVLAEAGIDMEVMKTIHKSMHAHREAMHEEIEDALEADDFEAFKAAVEGSPIADIVTTKEDFELFKEAHELKEAGDREAAMEIMSELGFEKPMHHCGHHGHFGHEED